MLKRRVIVIAAIILCAFGGMIIFDSFQGDNYVCKKIPVRTEYLPLKQYGEYRVTPLRDIVFPLIPEGYSDIKFSIQQYQPAVFEARKYPELESQTSLACPEDAFIASVSFYLRNTKSVFCIYPDSIPDHMDILNNPKFNKDPEVNQTIQELNNSKYYYRYLYKIYFKFKEKNVCGLVFNPIDIENPRNTVKWKWTNVSILYFVETPEGWKRAYATWFGNFGGCLGNEENLRAMFQMLPFRNAELDNDFYNLK